MTGTRYGGSALAWGLAVVLVAAAPAAAENVLGN